MTDLDEQIRRQQRQRQERSVETVDRSRTIHPKLKQLFDLIDDSEELREQGFAAQLHDDKIALHKDGVPYGEWSIHDAWFEYRGQTCKDQIYKAAWVEGAIALTSAIVTGVHTKARQSNGTSESSRLAFAIKQGDGKPIALIATFLDGNIPSLGSGELAFNLPTATTADGAERIARQMNRDIVSMTFRRRHA